jgi:hypothetical protein
MTHALKITSEYFDAILDGSKTFEVRKNDRPFKKDDAIILQEWHETNEKYTGNEWHGIITYILDSWEYCKKGYVILGIKQKEVDY